MAEMALIDLGRVPSRLFFLLDGNHLLAVSLVRYENGLQVPIFVLVQQPSPILKYSYDLNSKAFAIILKEQTHKIFGKCFVRTSPHGVKRIITDAMPLSFRFPQKDELEATDVQKQWNIKTRIEDTTKLRAVKFDKLTKFDRQRGWYVELKTRPEVNNGRPGVIMKDKYYKHLQSNLVCRSKAEVCYFIETGKRPPRKFTAEINKIIGDSSRRRRGSRLLDMREVGLYDEENKKIYRRPIMPTKSQPTTSEDTKRGNKKRKSEEGICKQGRHSQDAHPDPLNPKIHVLYDCQTLI